MKHLAITALFVMVPTITFADQSVYIDQAGENLNATIIQKLGDNNTIGDVTATDKYFYLDGDDMTLTFGMEGDANKLIGSIEGDTFDFTLSQIGDNNFFEIMASLSSSSSLTWNIVGSANEVYLNMGQAVSAEYTTLDYNITGNDNIFNIDIDTDGATHTFDMTGDSNEYSITQTGYGNSLEGHLLTIDTTGDFNTVTILQETTTAQSIIDMVINGSNQVISITQSD
jgi:hypothetical protein